MFLFLFIYLFIWLHQVLVVVCLTLRPYRCSPPVGFLCPLDSPGKNTGVDYNSLHRGGSSQPKAQAHVFTSPALMGVFFTASAIWEALIVACRTISLVPWPGIKTVPLYWEPEVLASGPRENSPENLLIVLCLITILWKCLVHSMLC